MHPSALPVVGIPCDAFERGLYPSHGVGEKYIDAVGHGAGVLPILLPCLEGGKDLRALSAHVDPVQVLDMLDGVFFTFREACKHMVERAGGGDKAGGSLVVISSLSAYDGAPRNEAYAATKGAVISMIRSIAVEHARYGVRANAVLPGWIATDMTAGAQGNDKFNDAVIRRVPARRWGQPADFGGIAVYLSSDASAFHTGDSFLIDGGYGIF